MQMTASICKHDIFNMCNLQCTLYAVYLCIGIVRVPQKLNINFKELSQLITPTSIHNKHFLRNYVSVGDGHIKTVFYDIYWLCKK